MQWDTHGKTGLQEHFTIQTFCLHLHLEQITGKTPNKWINYKIVPIRIKNLIAIIIAFGCKKETFENYQDRNTAALVGHYKAKVSDLYFPYIRPQENSYKTKNRWVIFTNNDGEEIKSTAPKYFGFSAHNKYNLDFDAGKKKQQRHTTDIKKRDFVNIYIDNQQMAFDGHNSWGAMPHKEYRIQSKEMSYRYSISKFSK